MPKVTPESVSRAAAAELDAILGQSFPVLDDGFVRAVDYMGTDGSIVQAARVSYGKGTKKISEDRALVRYLMRHRHTTPFEMCELKLHVRVPMDCWRQWIRHRTASVNEYSTRYSIAIDAAQMTPADAWRRQAKANRQGSEDILPTAIGKQLTEREAELQALSRDTYEERLKHGVAREQARKDLPLSTYTEAYWKIDLHNLLHFLALRMAPHAQQEIRAYATVIGEQIVRRWCPIAWDAFRDYRLNAVSLSALEREIVSALVDGDQQSAVRLLVNAGLLPAPGKPTKRSREREELESKLRLLNLATPWSSPA